MANYPNHLRDNFQAFALVFGNLCGSRGEWQRDLERQQKEAGKVQGAAPSRTFLDDREVYFGADADFLRSIGIDPEEV